MNTTKEMSPRDAIAVVLWSSVAALAVLELITAKLAFNFPGTAIQDVSYAGIKLTYMVGYFVVAKAVMATIDALPPLRWRTIPRGRVATSGPYSTPNS